MFLAAPPKCQLYLYLQLEIKTPRLKRRESFEVWTIAFRFASLLEFARFFKTVSDEELFWRGHLASLNIFGKYWKIYLVDLTVYWLKELILLFPKIRHVRMRNKVWFICLSGCFTSLQSKTNWQAVVLYKYVLPDELAERMMKVSKWHQSNIVNKTVHKDDSRKNTRKDTCMTL